MSYSRWEKTIQIFTPSFHHLAVNFFLNFTNQCVRLAHIFVTLHTITHLIKHRNLVKPGFKRVSKGFQTP